MNTPKPGANTALTSGSASFFYTALPYGTLNLDNYGQTPVVLNMYGGSFAPGLAINSVGYGAVAINVIGTTFDYHTFANYGTVHDQFGQLFFSVSGPTSVSNYGQMAALGGIGNNDLIISLNANTTPGTTAFVNYGDIAALGSASSNVSTVELNLGTSRTGFRWRPMAD